jgi:hypothetical protein
LNLRGRKPVLVSHSSGSSKCRQPGSYVIARYDNEWYVVQVVDNQENVQAGYILLHYTGKKGRNHFMWNKEKDDLLFTCMRTSPSPYL